MRTYWPITPLARGGMGRVDLALALDAPNAQRLVVLKRVHLDTPPEERAENARALRAEATIAARLDHPNVVATVDVAHDGDDLVLVLEYLEGVTVRDLTLALARRGERIPERVLLRIVHDALVGLDYVHEQRDADGTPLDIVHRDISPTNLFVRSDGTTKVLDFGVAKARTLSHDTPLGWVKGKLRYMAPEHVVGAPVDRRADIFAMGVVLWETLTNEPFGGVSPEATLALRLSDECPRVSTYRPIAPALDEIVASCLRLNLSDRPPNAGAVARAIALHAEASGGLASAVEVAGLVQHEFGSRFLERRAQIGAFCRAKAPERTPPVRLPAPRETKETTTLLVASFAYAVLGLLASLLMLQ